MLRNFCNSLFFFQRQVSNLRCYSTEFHKFGNFSSLAKSIGDKGFLRPYKAYEAPSNVRERLNAICANLKIPNSPSYQLKSLEDKFKLLQACFNDFRHSVPNSEVHELKTVGDVANFYQTSVNITTPYEALKQMELPENLHIQYDYVRFNGEKDTKFGGKTAFPKSSTLVTGLKYRGKYEGYEAKQSWP